MRIYLNEHPRTFVLVESVSSLIIRHPNPTYELHEHSLRHIHHIHHDKSNSKDSRADQKGVNNNKVIVEYVKTELLNLSSFKDVTPRKNNKLLHGFLGFLNVKGYIHLGIISKSTKVASPTVTESIRRIDDVEFYCVNNDRFDSWINKTEEEIALGLQDDVDGSLAGYPAASVKRLLSLGRFYFSKEFNVTTTIQERGISTLRSHNEFEDSYFRRFAWNSYMISSLWEMRDVLNAFERDHFDRSGFMTVITRGYAKTLNIKFLGQEDALLTLISKQSCLKNGSLFGEWGCDDEGSVSNFVENEIIVYSERFCFSYVLVRGNVPSYWELQNTFSKKNLMSSKISKKILFTRSFDASRHAFARHFETLAKHFGDVHIVNCLLQDCKTYKGQLNEDFTRHLAGFIRMREQAEDRGDPNEITNNSLSSFRLTYSAMPISTSFVKKVGYSPTNPPEIVGPLSKYMADFGATFFDSNENTYVGKQLGVFRINSFDCLTKANFICKILSQEVIELAFRDMNIPVPHELLTLHAQLWGENDEVLKRLTSSSLHSASKIKASNSSSSKNSIKQQLTRKYLNVVGEVKTNEIAILKLLGRLQDQTGVVLFNPFHHYVSLELEKRAELFVFKREIQIFASTFNVNGTIGDDSSMENWLFPSKHDVEKSYDLVFIGFQEIVELTPGKMLNVKSDNFLLWEKKIKGILDAHCPKNETYVSLWSWQIGGVAVLLFVKESHVGFISNIEGSIKKTGLGGMSANKGGVAVSFNYSKTLFCFICSHLAAGFHNVDERHQNYKTLAKGLIFSKRKKIRDHDAVIWLGDFNYRINLHIDQVKSMISDKNFQKLFELDQLNKQMADGETFPFYDEMEITFPPTYKFDNNTKVYDTSEKQRIPAWTDRILSLSKGKVLKQEVYDCEEDVIFSDHRPVYSIFRAEVKIINEQIKKDMMHEIYENYKNTVGDLNILLTANDVTAFVTDAGDNVMPPPSSDRTKWWLEGAPAKVNIAELQEKGTPENETYMMNPNLPRNPFTPTSEPEFIKSSNSKEEIQI